MFDLIKRLSELPGPAGQEDEVLDYVSEVWERSGAHISQAPIGNIVASFSNEGPKLLLVAHADEICYLVRDIDPSGFIWLASGQSWRRQISWRESFHVGQRVSVLSHTGQIKGVVAFATGHLASHTLREPTELTWDDLWVDTGLTKKELESRGVAPGSRVIWNVSTEKFGSLVIGKALDNRVSLAVLTEVARRLSSEEIRCNLVLASTVQEESGMIGAAALAAHESYDAAIVLEIGLSTDIPGLPSNTASLSLGGGPILVHKDSLVHYDRALTSALEEAARQSDIRIQHAVFGSFGSDGVALMKAGIPTALVAFPARYTHTPFETCHLRDIEMLVEWLCAFIGDYGSV